MTNVIIIDGWNLFSYEGIPNDSKEKKTVGVKQLGENFAEIFLNVETGRFDLYKNGICSFTHQRFSMCIRMADAWFSEIELKEAVENDMLF